MNARWSRAALALGSFVALFACHCTAQLDAQSEDPAIQDDAIGSTTLLTCKTLSVIAGGIGSGQSASTLAKADLTGSQDDWSKYVEFAPGSQVTCKFKLPSSIDPSSLSSLQLRANYRGPLKAEMPWTFEVRDLQGNWSLVTDNGFAKDWRWTRKTVALPGAPASWVKSQEILIRYRTTSQLDEVSQLDELVLIATQDTGGIGGSGGAAGAPATGGAAGKGGAAGSTGGSGASGGSGGTSGTGGTAGKGGAGGTAGSGGTGGSSGNAGSGGSGGSSGAGGSGGSANTIWVPAPGTTWQWQLSGAVNTSYDVAVYDIDLFDATPALVAQLHAQGKKVICYMSAGSYEDWRPDAGDFPAVVLGGDYSGWAGEKWLDIRRIDLLGPIMTARMDLCKSKGFDGIEPDNVDAYSQGSGETGFPLTAAHQLTYNKWFATEAHKRGLSVGLKNDTDQVNALVSYFDFVVTEDCFHYDECAVFNPFIAANKAVFAAEYTSTGATTSSFCSKAKQMKVSAILKKLDLDAWVQFCP
ncbi:MAG: endo alpha-1,4 polygalactosaminidase [Deltaproteobacteria bacterium]|nr:endo alpha-1,4 polygalactosaminidase [Deltaproteobacteria bacterium]